MESDSGEKLAVYNAQLEAATGALQVALNYQAELNRDYSRPIEHFNAIARGAYEMARQELDSSRDSEDEHVLEDELLRESDSEWIMMDDAGETAKAVEEHEKRLDELPPAVNRCEDTELETRKNLRAYECLLEAAREYEVAELMEIDEPLTDEEEYHIPDEDAVLF